MNFLVPAFFLTASYLCAAEYAVLASGGRLRIDRHEARGDQVQLYSGTGYIELDAAKVVGYEAEERVASVAGTAVTELSQVSAAARLSPRQLADAAADKYGLPRELVRSVMAAESGFAVQAESPKGALGLMQLMPSTAQALGANPRDTVQNVDAGARYLRELLEKYNGGLYHALAAYNAGPAAVDKYKGVPPFPETVNYVSRIAGDLKKADLGSNAETPGR